MGVQVSVIVPFRNARSHLPAFVDALKSQTCGPDAMQVILVDDGSRDEGADWLQGRIASGWQLLRHGHLGQNIGTIDWYTAIPIREDAVAKYFVGPENEYILNPAYRGEAFFDEPAGTGSLTATPVFRPNSIAVSVNVRAPAILVIYQNFHRDWHADHGEVFRRGGRLAVQLNETGTYVVHLRYHPRSFYVGLALTMSTLLGLVWVCWTYATGRLNRWSHCGPLVLRHSSRGILLLIK